jgi:hypothetical protein
MKEWREGQTERKKKRETVSGEFDLFLDPKKLSEFATVFLSG